MSVALHKEAIPLYMKERFEALRSGDKYRWRAFLKKWYAGPRQLPRLEDIERGMHMVRAQEMSLPPREREKSANWLRLYNKFMT